MRKAPRGGRAEQLVEMMDRQVTHLVRLIDDLLDISASAGAQISLRRSASRCRTPCGRRRKRVSR